MKSHVLIIGLCLQFLLISLFSQEFSTLDEIYNFDSEDEFQTIHYNCCNDVFFLLHKIQIIERQETTGAIYYIRTNSLFNFAIADPPFLTDTIHFNNIDTLIIRNPDSIIFNNGDEIIFNEAIYNGRKISIKHSMVNGKPKIDKYVNGCGLAVSSWYITNDSSCKISDSLVYFKKGNELWGENYLLSINNKNTNSELIIYPNPTHNIIHIRPLNHNSKIQVKLYDLNGKEIQLPKLNLHGKIHQLDLSHFKKGVYLLHINMADRNKVCPIVKF